MKKTTDIITIGFALFAMFFGAGNLLLPPFIGLQVGTHIWVTIFAFGLTGILLPFFGILAVSNSGESLSDLGNRVHPKLAPIIGTIIMICIGPLIAIPRTAATTFEVGILPSFPNSHPIWTTLAFFALTWALSIVPSKVVDLVGNLLTPFLLVLLSILIIIGITSPVASPVEQALPPMETFSFGLMEGYQTLDVLASVVFAGIIITATRAKGYTTVKEKNKVVITAGALAAGCLLFIYGGLIYLGASSGVENLGIKRSELLIHISHSVLGQYGTLAIALSIALACLTTAIALTTAVGTFFNKLSKGRLSYKFLVTLSCVVSGIFSVTGVDNIIQIAYPPLAFVYPIVMTLVLFVVIFGKTITAKFPYIGAMLASTIIATLNILKMFNFIPENILALLNKIPFFEQEVGWIIPSFAFFFLFWAIDKYRLKNTIA